MITGTISGNDSAASIADTISIEPRGKSPDGKAHFVTITIAGAVTFAAAIKCTDYGCMVMLPYSISGHGWGTRYHAMHCADGRHDDAQTNYIVIPSSAMQRAITAKACDYMLARDTRVREMIESQRHAVLSEHPNAQHAAHSDTAKRSRGAA